MKVLVTGATGFVGQEVVRQLHAAGHAIRILARNLRSSTTRDAAAHGAEIRVGDVLDAASLTGAADGCDAVIHLVGIISEVGEQTFENVHVRATRNILAEARRAGVRRFVHMSALGSRPDAMARYHQTKWAAEEAVRASGLDWTIFRPSLIFGPRDHFVNLFAKMARYSPVLPVMGAGRTRFQPVAVEDVATSFVKALSEPRAVGRTFDLCGPDRVTLPEILHAILAVTRRRRLVVRVPMALARAQAAAMEWLFTGVFGKPPPLNRDQLTMLAEDNVGDPRPAMELFGITPIPFREGIVKHLSR